MQWQRHDLLRVSGAYWQTCTLHAGVKLDIFTCLGDRPRSGDRIAQKLDMNRRGIVTLLNGLAAMGLLDKQETTYANTPSSARFLSRDSDDYIGHIILHHHHLADAWVNMDQAMARGGPIRKFSASADETVRESFLMGMFNIAMATAPGLAQSLDLSGCRRLLDLGGGPGTYAIQFCLANPQLQALILDLPTTRPFAEKTARQFGVQDRVTFSPGDYTEEGFSLASRFDAAWLSQILHGEGPEAAGKVVARAARALEPGGRLFIHEFILDNTLDSPLFPALFSLNMFLGTPEGKSYSEQELTDLMADAGLTGIRRLDFTGPNASGILVGRKP